MPKLPQAKTVDGVLAAGPAAFLVSQGFRRRSRTFNRNCREFVQSVFFQTRQHAPFAFRVKLAVVHPFHAEILRGARLAQAPNLENTTCIVRGELAFSPSEAIGNTLFVTPETPAQVLARSVVDRLPDALAFLDHWSSFDSILPALQSAEASDCLPPQPLVHAAVLLAFRGDHLAATQMLSLLSSSLTARVQERLSTAFGGSPNPSYLDSSCQPRALGSSPKGVKG